MEFHVTLFSLYYAYFLYHMEQQYHMVTNTICQCKIILLTVEIHPGSSWKYLSIRMICLMLWKDTQFCTYLSTWSSMWPNTCNMFTHTRRTSIPDIFPFVSTDNFFIKFLQLKICHVENFSMRQFAKWRNFSIWQIFSMVTNIRYAHKSQINCFNSC